MELAHGAALPKLDAVGMAKGARAQAYHALRHMAAGRKAQASHAFPESPMEMMEHRKRMLFERMATLYFWETAQIEKISGEVVPGTSHPRAVFGMLLRNGWIQPDAAAHWIPNMRCYVASDKGREALAGLEAWWSQLGWHQKLWAMLTE